MSDSNLTLTAKGVVDLLTDNAGSLSKTFTVGRGYAPIYDLTKVQDVMLYVVGTAGKVELNDGTRNESPDTYTVMVAVYGKVSRNASDGQISTADVDAMSYFVQEVCDLLIQNKGIANGTLWVLENPIAFDPDTLDTSNVFYTIIRLDYMAFNSH